MRANWSRENLISIISKSISRKDTLLKLGIRSAGSNFKTLSKYIDLYKIDTSHFIKNYDRMRTIKIDGKKKLSDILVENSNFSRTHLKDRLYEEGLLERKCCLCGQDENWNGMKISLILDHENGIYNDNQIENLRIVCPNCNAGLETFAGRNTKIVKKKYFCDCGVEISKMSSKCLKCEGKERRKVERPSENKLVEEVSELGYSAVGRKYGVSDNAIRKWIRKYKLETLK